MNHGIFCPSSFRSTERDVPFIVSLFRCFVVSTTISNHYTGVIGASKRCRFTWNAASSPHPERVLEWVLQRVLQPVLQRVRTMKVCQLVIGPAGSGKSTFCETIKLHCDAANRIIHLVNLDPAAEDCKYPVSVDIRELISLDDAMEECELGPNGGLLFCLEYLEENVEWLMEALEPYGEEDYLLIDCPGQIEAYSHLFVFNTVVRRYVYMVGGHGPRP